MRWTGFLCVLLATLFARAQQPPSMTPEAQAYLDQVSGTLLQRAPGNPAFHLKAVFRVTPFSPASAKTPPAVENGSYEEIWLSRTEWRRDINIGGKAYAIGRHAGEIWQTASGADVPMAVQEVMQCILPTISAIDRRPLTSKKPPPPIKLTRVQLSGIQLDRVGDAEHDPHNGKRNADEFAYYFVPDSHFLLSIAMGPGAIEFKKSGVFAGKTVLASGRRTSLLYQSIDFSIEALTDPPEDSATRLIPPAGAHIQVVPPNGTGEETSARCVSCPQPRYPGVAKTAHVSGTVVMAGVVGVDGRVTELKLVSGPPLLRQAAMDAVKDWQYEPARVDGVAIAVDTYLTTTFEIF